MSYFEDEYQIKGFPEENRYFRLETKIENKQKIARVIQVVPISRDTNDRDTNDRRPPMRDLWVPCKDLVYVR